MADTKFKVMFSTVGDFKKGDIITVEEAKKIGADVEFWKQTGAIRELDENGELVPLASEQPAAPAAVAPTPSEIARLVREELARQREEMAAAAPAPKSGTAAKNDEK